VNVARELRAESYIKASPAAVWSVLTDLKVMAEGSPELITMIPLLPGGLRMGQTYVGLNRRGPIVWPTRNVVATYEPEKALAWDTKTSGARWIFELAPEGDGTRLVHRRPVPKRITAAAHFLHGVLLGGMAESTDKLESGMADTVWRIRIKAESGE
jgi:uncharacterized protein YndB with AHSA1/START domain